MCHLSAIQTIIIKVSRPPPLPSLSLPRPFLSLSLFHSTTSGNQTIGGRCAGAEQKPHQLHLILQSAHYKDSAQPPTPRQIVASAPVSLRVQPALLCSCVLSISLTLFSSPCSPGCSAPAPVSLTASALFHCLGFWLGSTFQPPWSCSAVSRLPRYLRSPRLLQLGFPLATASVLGSPLALPLLLGRLAFAPC